MGLCAAVPAWLLGRDLQEPWQHRLRHTRVKKGRLLGVEVVQTNAQQTNAQQGWWEGGTVKGEYCENKGLQGR